MARRDGWRTRRMRVLLAPADLQALGQAIVEARPSVVFTTATEPTTVHRSMPAQPTFVEMHDGRISPGLGLPEIAWHDPEGMSIQIDVPQTSRDCLAESQIGTVFNPANQEHLAFVDAVFSAATRLTKPHLTFLDGTKVPVRVGHAAEAWWCDDEERYFQGGAEWIRYRLAKPCPGKG